MVKPHCSNLMIITAIFRKFKIVQLFTCPGKLKIWQYCQLRQLLPNLAKLWSFKFSQTVTVVPGLSILGQSSPNSSLVDQTGAIRKLVNHFYPMLGFSIAVAAQPGNRVKCTCLLGLFCKKKKNTDYCHIWATSWENLFMQYANNKGADQPAHPCSLISTFVFAP